MHVRVVCLEPFFAFLGGAAEFTVLRAVAGIMLVDRCSLRYRIVPFVPPTYFRGEGADCACVVVSLSLLLGREVEIA